MYFCVLLSVVYGCVMKCYVCVYGALTVARTGGGLGGISASTDRAWVTSVYQMAE